MESCRKRQKRGTTYGSEQGEYNRRFSGRN